MCLPAARTYCLRCLKCLHVCCCTIISGVLAYSNIQRKGLLRPCATTLSYPQLMVIEKTIAALMLARPRILRPYLREAQPASPITCRDTTHADMAAVAKAILSLLSEECPLLLYLGHVVQEFNWARENNHTGPRAHEVLELSLCLFWNLRRRLCDTVLKYERTIMCTVPYNSKWHQDLPGQAQPQDFGDRMLSNVVRDRAKNTGFFPFPEMENHNLLLQVGPGGRRVGVQNLPKNLVQKMPQRLMGFLVSDRICMAYFKSERN